MTRRKQGEPPRLQHHKSSGQGYITIEGKRFYLGRFGSVECRRRYRAELHRWDEEHRPCEVRARTLYFGRGSTVAELVHAFMEEIAAVRYCCDGEPTQTYRLFRQYLVTELAVRYGDLLADEFRHQEYADFRHDFITRGYSRNTMKALRSKVMVLFRWGHRRGAVSAETLTSLETSAEPDEGLEREPVNPVPEEHLQGVLAFLDGRKHQRYRRLADMIRVQELVGMRPGELCRMRAREIRQDSTARSGSRTVRVVDAGGEPYRGWLFQPERHKTKRRGVTIYYPVGPKARAILEHYLPQNPDGFVWPGRNGHSWFRGYYMAVRAACDGARVPRWHPNQLRHNTVSRYTLHAGIEKASKIVSHSRLETTAIYAEKNLADVVDVVEKYG